MRRLIGLIFLFCLMAETVYASALGSGSMTINGLDNASFRYGSSGGYFGISHLSDPTQTDNTHANFYFEPGTYAGSGSSGLNRVAGSFDIDTGASMAAEVYAQSPGNGYTTSMIMNTRGYADIWSGKLAPFSYDYTFSGITDSPDSALTYVIQMQVAWWNEETRKYELVYTDFNTNFPENRTNWIQVIDAENGITYSGTRSFDFSNYSERRWFVEWSFSVGAKDFSDQPMQSPVPEPATMILFGIGLLGLSGISRQRKQ